MSVDVRPLDLQGVSELGYVSRAHLEEQHAFLRRQMMGFAGFAQFVLVFGGVAAIRSIGDDAHGGARGGAKELLCLFVGFDPLHPQLGGAHYTRDQ